MTAPIPPVPVDYLVAWLRRHKDAFREEALRDRLLAAGYPPADVDAAFEMLRLEPDATPGGAPSLGIESPRVPPPGPSAWSPSPASEPEGRLMRDSALAFVGALGAIIGIPWLLATVGAAAYALPVALIFVLLAFAGWAGSRHGAHPGVATGLGVALLLVVVLPTVAVVAVFGFCLVAGGRLN
jgi:hypothetical protein